MDELLPLLPISQYEHNLLKTLIDFYQNKNNISILYSIVKLQFIPIRLIDYFITKYCKIQQIIIDDVKIYLAYKQQLKSYQKTYFDSFSRGLRIPYIQDNFCFITTIGQLNFFMWIINNNLHLYIINNIKCIEEHMKLSSNKKSIRIHRQELNNIKKMSTHCISSTNATTHVQGNPILITF
jgi:hypothetical protein